MSGNVQNCIVRRHNSARAGCSSTPPRLEIDLADRMLSCVGTAAIQAACRCAVGTNMFK